ncbi:MAG: CehA/McbA family metallohydrolase [Gemmataceae bacterium]
MLTIHLRVNDAATGKPTPVRLRITGPDGTHYAPFGRLTEFATGKNEDVGGHLRLGPERWCYIDGACEVRLPAGVPLRVQAAKGPEYRPLDQTVTLGSGQMALRFGIERWSDVRADGWVPGDVRAHFLPPHAAALEAAAEDLSVVHLLARAQPLPSPDGTAYPTVGNLLAFSGQQPALTAEGPLVAVNTLNEHPVLGRVGLLHSHRPVYPLTFGGPDDTDDWSVCAWCDQCHRKGGLTVWADPFTAACGAPGGEALVAALLGKIDALEYDGRPRRQPLLPMWYRLLNAGVRVPLVGGSGKESNASPLGTPRTYAHLPAGEPTTLGGWAEAVRAGRCFVTTGPLLAMTVNGHSCGAVLPVGGVEQLSVRASARSLQPFDKLEVVADGQVVAAAEPTTSDGTTSAELEFSHPAGGSGWIAARCAGGSGSPTRQAVFAHTSPVYLRATVESGLSSDAASALRSGVDATREWVTTVGRFADPRRKAALIDLCDQALAVLARDRGGL